MNFRLKNKQNWAVSNSANSWMQMISHQEQLLHTRIRYATWFTIIWWSHSTKLIAMCKIVFCETKISTSLSPSIWIQQLSYIIHAFPLKSYWNRTKNILLSDWSFLLNNIFPLSALIAFLQDMKKKITWRDHIINHREAKDFDEWKKEWLIWQKTNQR